MKMEREEGGGRRKARGGRREEEGERREGGIAMGKIWKDLVIIHKPQ